MSALYWTTTRPTAPGWYWASYVRYGQRYGLGIVQVYDRDSGTLKALSSGWCGSGLLKSKKYDGVEWGGPIHVPCVHPATTVSGAEAVSP